MRTLEGLVLLGCMFASSYTVTHLHHTDRAQFVDQIPFQSTPQADEHHLLLSRGCITWKHTCWKSIAVVAFKFFSNI
jgi:hypothetical protein